MVKSRRKSLRQMKSVSQETNQARTLIILLVIVLLVSVGIYFLTDTMIKKENKLNSEVKDVEIDYDIATIGTMFNRIEDEYNVLIYSNEKDGNDLNNILDGYRSSDDYVKTYYVDLDNKLNSFALADLTTKKPKDSNEVKVSGATLYKLKDGKVIDCISGTDKIISELEG